MLLTRRYKIFFKVSGSSLEGVNVTFDLSNPFVVAGLLIGGMLPYLFGSMGMQVLEEQVEQLLLKLEDNLKYRVMKGKRKPDYGR